jgi:hypothetical protein
MNEKDFQKISLKKTETNDKSKPKIEKTENKELKEYIEILTGMYMENWYYKLEKYTFKSKIISVNVEEANLLMELNKKFLKLKESKILSEEEIEKEIFENLPKGIMELLNKIQESIEYFDNKAFVKLSSRSPKDVINDKVIFN